MERAARGAGLIYNRALSVVSIGGNAGEVLASTGSAVWQGQGSSTGIQRAVRAAAAVAGLTASLAMIAGCGNNYRPVVSGDRCGGPAAQMAKYAIAVSSPTQIPANGPITFVGAWSTATSYTINQGVSYLGSQYVSLQNANNWPHSSHLSGFLVPVGERVVDYGGLFRPTRLLVTGADGSQIRNYLSLDSTGHTAFTLNSDRTVTSWPITTAYLPGTVLQSTLLAGGKPGKPLRAVQYHLHCGPRSERDRSTAGTAARAEAGVAGGFRVYAGICAGPIGSPADLCHQRGNRRRAGAGGSNRQPQQYKHLAHHLGHATGGRGPVFGLMTLDSRARLRPEPDRRDGVGDQRADQRAGHSGEHHSGGDPSGVGRPCTGLDELVVAIRGRAPRMVRSRSSDIPLCTATSLPGNPNCDATNPVDAPPSGRW